MNRTNNCHKCGGTFQKQHGPFVQTLHGEKIEVPDIDYLRCKSCGETMTDLDNSQKVLEQSRQIYRQRHDLLSPQEIHDIRTRYRLSIEDLAGLLHAELRHVQRWEDGRAVQSRAFDVLLRVLRDLPGSYDLLRQRAA
jgi:putative zinc finger/helix-turn-helix YgiT family protein